MTVRITHIRLSGARKANEYITHVKWQADVTGRIGVSSRETMVDWLEAKKGRAYVDNGAARAPVGVVRPDGGPPYLRTHVDGAWTDNLLALPTF